MGMDERLAAHAEAEKQRLKNGHTPQTTLPVATREEVMTVLESEGLDNLASLKATFDAAKTAGRSQQIFALGKLVSTAYEGGLLNEETLTGLGLEPKISQTIMDVISRIEKGEQIEEKELKAIRQSVVE